MREKGARQVNWHQLDPAETAENLQSSERGLASEEARRRYEQYGPNELSGSRRQAVSAVRRELTLKLVHELGQSLAETGRQVGLTTSGGAQILRRKK